MLMIFVGRYLDSNDKQLMINSRTHFDMFSGTLRTSTNFDFIWCFSCGQEIYLFFHHIKKIDIFINIIWVFHEVWFKMRKYVETNLNDIYVPKKLLIQDRAGKKIN